MKLSHPVLALLMVAGTLIASQAAATDWADKMFTQREYDFRTVGRGTKAEFHFEFKNLYQEDVHVSAVRSSCGCTTPSLTTDTLKTHETGAVVAAFNTSSFIGKKSATITVVFDRPYFAEVQLKVSGNIRTDITFDPPEADFGDMAAGEIREQTVTITKTGSPNWRITDVRSHCDDLAVTLGQPVISPGSVRYSMTIKNRESLAEGDIRERLTILSNDQVFPSVEMSIVGRVRPTLSVSPVAASVGTVIDDQAVEQRLVVRGEEPFTITQIMCGDKRFAFDIPTDKKKLHFVKMRFTADERQGGIGQRIRIVTDLPDEKSVSFVVSGTVKTQPAQ